MSAARMITGLIGAFGGGAVGRMFGGRMGGTVGSLAGSFLMGKMRSGGGGGLGSMLGGLMGGDDDERDVAQQAAAAMPEDEAMILVRAMCSAAKADGNVSQDEIDAIVGRVQGLDGDDELMLRAELKSPLDLEGLIAAVPKGMEADVYAASLLPIEVDTASEVEYLQQLARGMGLSGDQVNEIHQELGLR